MRSASRAGGTMAAIDELARGIKHIDSLLAESVLEPDLARTDWAGMRVRVRLVQEAVESEMLALLAPVLEDLAGDEHAEVRGNIRWRVASTLCEASVLLFATGDSKGFR